MTLKRRTLNQGVSGFRLAPGCQPHTIPFAPVISSCTVACGRMLPAIKNFASEATTCCSTTRCRGPTPYRALRPFTVRCSTTVSVQVRCSGYFISPSRPATARSSRCKACYTEKRASTAEKKTAVATNAIPSLAILAQQRSASFAHFSWSLELSKSLPRTDQPQDCTLTAGTATRS